MMLQVTIKTVGSTEVLILEKFYAVDASTINFELCRVA
jgi:hypothetical protein